MKSGIVLSPVCQQTDSHCGPAVIQELLGFWGISATQDEITAAARAKSRIIRYGVRPDQLALAVHTLAPGYEFWFKQQGTAGDLEKLVKGHQIPVGVNWQALFYDSLAEEARDFRKPNIYGDHGHYSVVTGIDLAAKTVTINDTYSEYYLKPRTFAVDWFETRWWDVNVEMNKKTNLRMIQRFKRLMFVVVPKQDKFPQEIGMQLSDKLPGFELYTQISGETSQLKSHR